MSVNLNTRIWPLSKTSPSRGHEPITRRNRPFGATENARTVLMDERCSDERDRHRVAGTRIDVLEYVQDRELRRRIRSRWGGERHRHDA